MIAVDNSRVISLTYELRLGSEKGEVLESLNEQSPLTFLFGAGRLLPKFEKNIHGLKVGDSFKFDLQAIDAYGEMDDDAVVDVPLSAFEINGKVDEDMVRVGNGIPMQDSSGNRMNGIVKSIQNGTVTMDFNHPLAGGHLFFSGQITEVRDATEKELSHGHQKSGGCSCSCSCDDGGGECC